MRCSLVIAVLASLALAGGADQARSLLKKGDAQGAKEAAERLVDKDEKNADAWLVLADALLQLEEPAEAWSVLERGIAANPGVAALPLRLGDTFVRMAELETSRNGDGTTIRNYYMDAERMYDEALAADPKSADAVYGKAYAAYTLQDADRARKLIAECLGINKDYAKAHALQAYILYNDKKYPEAARVYEIALKLDDGDPVDMVRYGHCFYAQGDMEKAKAAYIAAIKRHPTDETAIRSGLYHVAGRDWSKMTGVLKEAVATAPNSPAAWNFLGYVQFVNGSFEEAREAYKKALAIDGTNAAYLYGLGYAHEKLGHADQALESYRKALKSSPDYADAVIRFAGLIKLPGDMDTAEKLYEELLTLAPSTGYIRNNYALVMRDWAEQRGAAKDASPPPEVRRRIKRSGEVYEMAAALMPDDAQVQSDTGLLFEFYPCIRDDEKAELYFRRSLDVGGYCYRDAFNGLDRLCRRTGNWELLSDYAELVLGALEDGGQQAIAPSPSGSVEPIKFETPRMIAAAKKAIADAKPHLRKEPE